jgi:hypothetical protein
MNLFQSLQTTVSSPANVTPLPLLSKALHHLPFPLRLRSTMPFCPPTLRPWRIHSAAAATVVEEPAATLVRSHLLLCQCQQQCHCCCCWTISTACTTSSKCATASASTSPWVHTTVCPHTAPVISSHTYNTSFPTYCK